MNLLKAISSLFHFNRTNWKAVILCFLAAAVFWLFNALNKTYSTNIHFPLSFEYDQGSFMPAQALPTHVLINVSGQGWDLSRKHFGVKLPELAIPLERPTEVHRIAGNSLEPLLASQLGALKINFVVTDTLRIHIDPADFYPYRVVADLSGIRFREGWGRTSVIQLSTDTVRLDGPRSILQELPDSLIVKPTGSRVNSDFSQDAEIEVPSNDFIKRTPPMVNVRFKVGPVEQIAINAPIITDKKLLRWPDSVRVALQVPKGIVPEERKKLREVKALLPSSQYGIPRITGLPEWAILLQVDSVSSSAKAQR